MKALIGYYYKEVFCTLELREIYYTDDGIEVSTSKTARVRTNHKLSSPDEFKSDDVALNEYKYKHYPAIMMAEVGEGVSV